MIVQSHDDRGISALIVKDMSGTPGWDVLHVLVLSVMDLLP